MSQLPRAPTFPALPDEVRESASAFASSRQEDSEQAPTSSANTSAFVESSTNPTTAKPPLGRPSNAAHSNMNESSSSSIPTVPLPVAPSKSRIRNVLLWRDSKVSGLIFGGFMLFFYLTLFKKLSILSVLGALLAMYLSTGLVIVNVNNMTGNKLDPYIARPSVSTPIFKKEVVNHWAETVMEEGNEIGNDVRDVLYCDKTNLTLTWIFLGLVAYIAGRYFSLLPVFFVLTLLAFSLPLAYEKNKTEVDNAVAKATECASKHLETGRKIAGERAGQLREIAAEKLDKAPPAIRSTAARVGLAPAKKSS